MDGYPHPLAVEGLWPSTSSHKTLTNKLQVYFLSKKKSRGGDCVVKFSEQSSAATVFFKQAETRDQVLAKGDHSVTIENHTVKLKVFKPGDEKSRTENPSEAAATGSDVAASAQQAVGRDESQRDEAAESSSRDPLEESPRPGAVVLENLLDKLSKEFLVLLVENISNAYEEEFSMEIITESDVAVVTFNDPSVAEKFLMESSGNKMFQQYGLTSRALEKTRSIRVENLSAQCSTELLDLYFEKWGGKVEDITMIPNEQAATVTFCKQEGVEKTLGMDHCIGNTPVIIYPYFTSLGSALYGKDRPTWTPPKPYTEKIHPAIREFLCRKDLISAICKQMESVFCQVNMDKDEVQLSPLPALLKQKNITKKHIDSWKQNSTDEFRDILSNYAVFEHAVIPSLWSTIEKDIQSVVKDKAFMSMDDGLLTLAGMAKDIKLLQPILENVLKKASDQLDRDKTSVSESIAVSPAMYSLFLHKGLQDTAIVGRDESQRDEAAESSSRDPLEESPRPGAVVLENLPDNFSKEFLVLLVENISNASEEEISMEMITELNVAVVTFNDPSVAEKFLMESSGNKKFQQYGLTSRALEKTRSIKVDNVPAWCSTDLLDLYFEKWGGKVEDITMIPDEQAATVTFCKQEGVEKTLGMDHRIGNTPVTIYPYFTSLGSALCGKDRPTWTPPKPYTEKIHPAIREFLCKKDLISAICKQMESVFCQVNMDKDEVQLSPLPALLKQKNITKKHIDSWKQNSTDEFRDILSNYTVFEHAVIPSMWSTIEKDIQSVVKDKAYMSMDDGLLTLAGMAKDVKLLQPILENVLKKASDQLDRDKTSVSESIAVSPAMYSLFLHEGLQNTALVGCDESQRDEAAEPSPRGPLEESPRPGAVVLENLPDNFSKEVLVLIVENISNTSEEEFSMEIITESDVVVVTFNDPSVAEKFLMESSGNKKFQQYGLTSRALEKTRSIRVENLSAQCSTELLDLYFEKWGGKVEDITMIPNEQAATVTFCKQEGVEKTLGMDHRIGNTPVTIYPYFTSLGSALYGKDRPTWTPPKPYTEKIHPAIREFLCRKDLISAICKQMESVFCQVNMDKDEVQLSPLPALLKQKNITKQYIDSWKQNSTDEFRDILSNYTVLEHAVIPSLWSTIEKDIQSVVKDKAFMSMDDGLLTLAGMAKDVKLLQPILENVLKKASDQLDRDKTSVSESIAVSPAMYSLFLHEGLQNTALGKYPELKLTHNSDTNQLTLCGLPVEIIDIKNWILEKKVNMKQKTLKIDPSLLEFLRSGNSEEMSGDLFTSKGICAVYKVENRDVVLTGSTDRALTEAETRVQMTLASSTLSLEDVGVIEKPEWRSLSNQLYDTYNSAKTKTVVITHPDHRDRLIVSGFKDPVSEVSRSLEKFINMHSRIKEVIRVRSYAVVKFVRDKKAKVWQKLVKPSEVTVDFDPKRPVIRLSGERVHVQPATENLKKIADALHIDKLTIKKAGAKKYFQEQGSMFLLMMKEHRFVVILEESHMLEEDEDDYEEDRVEDFGQLSCEVQIPGGILITVRKADICQFKVDAVVNSTNDNLQHVGGVAAALLKAAGPNLQAWSNQYISVNGQVPPGKAITTEAGFLPCKYVVHAVGPRYSASDKATAVRRLRQAVRESLNQAENKQCSSIAIPAISSGIFGFPLELCTETIAKELHAYVEDQKRQGGMNMLRQIHLVDNNSNAVNAMAQAVRKEFTAYNPKMNFPKHTRSHGSVNRGRGNRDRGYHGPGKRGNGHHGPWPKDNEPPVYRRRESVEEEPQGAVWKENPSPLSRTQYDDSVTQYDRSVSLETQSTQEGLRIFLKKGNIQDANSEVIVNTISEDVDLSKGAVSKALLQAAGGRLQSEASSSTMGSSRLSHGDVVVTGGYNLNCQKVYHTVCPPWNRGADSEDEVLKQIIRECLKKAEQQNMFSISFPAIGTGNLGFPKDLVSSTLLREIHDFSARGRPRCLKEVTVFVHPSDNESVQSFINSFRGGTQGPITKGAHAVHQQSPKKSPLARPSQSSGIKGKIDSVTSFFLGSDPESTRNFQSKNEDFVMVGEEFEPAVFQLCAESQQDLKEARELITNFIVKEQTSSSIRDSAINHFTREDAETLTNLQRELTVSIELNRNSPEPVITVEGLTRDVLKAENIIRDIIRKVEKNANVKL